MFRNGPPFKFAIEQDGVWVHQGPFELALAIQEELRRQEQVEANVEAEDDFDEEHDPKMYPEPESDPEEIANHHLYNPDYKFPEQINTAKESPKENTNNADEELISTATSDGNGDRFIFDWTIHNAIDIRHARCERSLLHPEANPMFFSPPFFDPKYNNSWKLGLQMCPIDHGDDPDYPNYSARPNICIYLEGELKNDPESIYSGLAWFGFGDQNCRYMHPDFRLRHGMPMDFQPVESDPTKLKVLVPFWEILDSDLKDYCRPDNTLRMRAIILYDKDCRSLQPTQSVHHGPSPSLQDAQDNNFEKHCKLFKELFEFESGKDSDITILTGDDELYVHKCVLEAREVFGLLEDYMVKDTGESPGNIRKNSAIDLTKFPKVVVRGFMEFVYYAEITETDISILKETFSLAQNIGYEHLMEYIMDLLISLISDEICGELYFFAVENGLSDLKVACGEYIKKYGWKLKDDVEFMEYVKENPQIFEAGNEYFRFLSLEKHIPESMGLNKSEND